MTRFSPLHDLERHAEIEAFTSAGADWTQLAHTLFTTDTKTAGVPVGYLQCRSFQYGASALPNLVNEDSAVLDAVVRSVCLPPLVSAARIDPPEMEAVMTSPVNILAIHREFWSLRLEEDPLDVHALCQLLLSSYACREMHLCLRVSTTLMQNALLLDVPAWVFTLLHAALLHAALRPAEALSFYTKCLSLWTDGTSSYDHLRSVVTYLVADCHERNGNQTQALVEYENARLFILNYRSDLLSAWLCISKQLILLLLLLVSDEHVTTARPLSPLLALLDLLSSEHRRSALDQEILVRLAARTAFLFFVRGDFTAARSILSNVIQVCDGTGSSTAVKDLMRLCRLRILFCFVQEHLYEEADRYASEVEFVAASPQALLVASILQGSDTTVTRLFTLYSDRLPHACVRDLIAHLLRRAGKWMETARTVLTLWKTCPQEDAPLRMLLLFLLHPDESNFTKVTTVDGSSGWRLRSFWERGLHSRL